MTHKIYIQYSNENQQHIDYVNLVEQAVNKTLFMETADITCVINILITNNEGIHRYNRDYRGVDSITDVLSFPMQTFQHAGWGGCSHFEFDEDSGELPIGDIVISLERVKEQAVEYSNTVEYEIVYLVIHSTLHLLGYDHDNEDNEKVMHDKCKIVIRETGFNTDDK